MKSFLRKHLYFLAALILSTALLWPLFSAPLFTSHDDVQIIRLYEMNKCIQDLQIPCRWVPDLGGEYGYPLFNYYAPLPYYYGEIFYLLTGSLIISVKIMFITSFLGSFFFMYLLARKLWGEMGGSLSAVFYAYAPYHAVDFYVRGAMGEMWGLLFFPAVYWAVLRLWNKVNYKNSIILGVLFAFSILSHNLYALIFLPASLGFGAVLFISNRSWPFLQKFVLGLILGLALASFYWAPALVEKNLSHVETTTYGYFHYTEHFEGLRKLFVERSWGYGSSVREVPGGEKDMLSYQVGSIHLLGWVSALISFGCLFKKDKKLGLIVGLSSLGAALSIFMINPKSQFIWDGLDFLKYLQFPWRFLGLVIFFVSFVSGSFMLCLGRLKNKAIIFFLIGLGLLVFANFNYFRPEKFIYVTDQELLTGANWDKQIKRSIFDYLPIFAKAPPAELATVRYQVISGKINISNFKERSKSITFDTESSDSAVVRISQYYFPEWKATIDGKAVKITYNNDLGLMTITVPAGQHKAEFRFYDTPIRLVSDIISFVTILGVSLFLLFPKLSKRYKR